jgi:nucleoid DNA-binding protein
MAAKKRVIKKKAKVTVKAGKKMVKKVAKKAAVGKKSKTTKIKVKKAMVVTKAAPKAKLDKVTKPYTKSELYKVLAYRTDLTRGQINNIFDELVEIIKLHLQKDSPEKFVLPGVLKMIVKNVPAKKARKGVNPFTGEPTIFKAKPASRKVKVAALKALKDLA